MALLSLAEMWLVVCAIHAIAGYQSACPSGFVQAASPALPCTVLAVLTVPRLQHAPIRCCTAFLCCYFRHSIPTPVFWPMLIVATFAAIVASQALISGAFSLMRQAMMLGVFPKLTVSVDPKWASESIQNSMARPSRAQWCILAHLPLLSCLCHACKLLGFTTIQVMHTSEHVAGQVYIEVGNGCMCCLLLFHTSK